MVYKETLLILQQLFNINLLSMNKNKEIKQSVFDLPELIELDTKKLEEVLNLKYSKDFTPKEKILGLKNMQFTVHRTFNTGMNVMSPTENKSLIDGSFAIFIECYEAPIVKAGDDDITIMFKWQKQLEEDNNFKLRKNILNQHSIRYIYHFDKIKLINQIINFQF